MEGRRRRNGKILVDKKMGFKKGEVRDVRERPQDYWVESVRDAVRFASEQLFLWEINKGSWRETL